MEKRLMVSKAKGKWTIKGIVGDGDNWERYQEAYRDKVSESQVGEVEKMLGCGDPSKGFASYICLECGGEKRVPFSCKSRICSGCGKVYADAWSEGVSSRMLKVTHRHITMTVASELWEIFEGNAEWRCVLFEAADATLKKVMKNRPGIVVTLHPYGKDLKVNYHVHVLVTEGRTHAVREREEGGRWKSQSYIHYEGLRKIWQYEVLTRLRELMEDTVENQRLINELFTRYQSGFYVHGEPKVKDGQGIGRYIGRYLRHPAIADSRIVSYDGREVTYSYQVQEKGKKVRCEERLPVLDFMHGVIRHIPPKQFKMVRYYGLYAPRKSSAVKQLMLRMGNLLGRAVRHLDWHARRIRDFHIDPLLCACCGSTEMVLFSLSVPNAGKLVLLGGWPWLFARGDLIEPSPPHEPAQQSLPECAPPPQPSPVQLALAF